MRSIDEVFAYIARPSWDLMHGMSVYNRMPRLRAKRLSTGWALIVDVIDNAALPTGAELDVSTISGQQWWESSVLVPYESEPGKVVQAVGALYATITARLLGMPVADAVKLV